MTLLRRSTLRNLARRKVTERHRRKHGSFHLPLFGLSAQDVLPSRRIWAEPAVSKPLKHPKQPNGPESRAPSRPPTTTLNKKGPKNTGQIVFPFLRRFKDESNVDFEKIPETPAPRRTARDASAAPSAPCTAQAGRAGGRAVGWVGGCGGCGGCHGDSGSSGHTQCAWPPGDKS